MANTGKLHLTQGDDSNTRKITALVEDTAKEGFSNE